MKSKAQQELIKAFDSLKDEVLLFIEKNNKKFPKDAFRIYFYILKKLDAIIDDLGIDHAGCSSIKYQELSRAVIELPSTLMDVKLGSKIINCERRYINMSASKYANEELRR